MIGFGLTLVTDGAGAMRRMRPFPGSLAYRAPSGPNRRYRIDPKPEPILVELPVKSTRKRSPAELTVRTSVPQKPPEPRSRGASIFALNHGDAIVLPFRAYNLK